MILIKPSLQKDYYLMPFLIARRIRFARVVSKAIRFYMYAAVPCIISYIHISPKTSRKKAEQKILEI